MIEMRKQDRKLIAAETSNDVTLAEHLLQPASNLLEQQIAMMVSQRVKTQVCTEKGV
jgi:hypothetical protein